jgi:hypothetical protein
MRLKQRRPNKSFGYKQCPGLAYIAPFVDTRLRAWALFETGLLMSHCNTSIILYGRYEPKPVNMEKIVRPKSGSERTLL